MTTLTWVGGSSSSFSDKKNWSPQTVPNASSDARIAPSAATAIAAGDSTINSLTTNANTTLTIGATHSFTILDKPDAANPTGTSVNGGTIVLNSAADLFLSGTFDNTGRLATKANSDVWLRGTLDNTGAIQQSGDVHVGNASVAGSLVNAAGAHWSINGNVDVVGGTAAGSRLSNAGTLTRNGLGVTDVTVATINSGNVTVGSGTLEFLRGLKNTGTMTASGATLFISRPIAGTGALDITANGTLHLVKGTGAGQTVDFTGTGTLDLNTPSVFGGTIAGFGASDLIDLIKTPATGATFSGGVLSVHNGGATVASLHFSGNYSTASFLVTSDNHGDSLIHFV
jgi:hypothetical protein